MGTNNLYFEDTSQATAEASKRTESGSIRHYFACAGKLSAGKSQARREQSGLTVRTAQNFTATVPSAPFKVSFSFKTGVALVLFLFMTTALDHAAEWEALPSLLEGSGNFICGSYGDDLVLAGGIGWHNDSKIWRDNLWRFDSKEKRWIESGKLPERVAYAAFGQTTDGIYFAGGSDGTNTHRELRFLNRKLQVQSLPADFIPLCYSGSALADGKMFVVSGGTDANNLKTLTNLFYAIDLNKGKVTSLPQFPGGNLLIPTASILGKKLFVFGGASFDSENRALNTSAAFAYSLSEKVWSTIKSYPFPVRGLASCTLDDRYILLGGGYIENFTDAAFLYDTKTDSYLKTKSLPYRAMTNFIKVGEYIYWVGGEDRMKHRSDLAFRIQWKKLLAETLAEHRSEKFINSTN